MKDLAQKEVGALSLAAVFLLLVSAAALAATGALTQPPGTAGCISDGGSDSCANGHGLDNPESVAVSPDNKSVYVATDYAVVRLNRTTSGAISQPAATAGCISEDGSGPCADGHGLYYASSVAVSPDNKSVYVATYYGVVRLNRNTSNGAISQPTAANGCISEGGAHSCANGHGLYHPTSVAVSPDGKSVYVASRSGAQLVRLNRNTSNGAISQPAAAGGCISQDGSDSCADGYGLRGATSVAVSPDGKSVYVAAHNGDDVARFNRTAGGAISQPTNTHNGCISEVGIHSDSCASGYGLANPSSVAVSPDGKSVYVSFEGDASGGGVTRLNRTSAGAISQPSVRANDCISGAGSNESACADGNGFYYASSVAVSPDNKSVYVASSKSPIGVGAVARLNRNTTNGAISQPTGANGCMSEYVVAPCAAGRGLQYADSVAVSPDNKSVYVGSASNFIDAVARFNRAP